MTEAKKTRLIALRKQLKKVRAERYKAWAEKMPAIGFPPLRINRALADMQRGYPLEGDEFKTQNAAIRELKRKEQEIQNEIERLKKSDKH